MVENLQHNHETEVAPTTFSKELVFPDRPPTSESSNNSTALSSSMTTPAGELSTPITPIMLSQPVIITRNSSITSTAPLITQESTNLTTDHPPSKNNNNNNPQPSRRYVYNVQSSSNNENNNEKTNNKSCRYVYREHPLEDINNNNNSSTSSSSSSKNNETTVIVSINNNNNNNNENENDNNEATPVYSRLSSPMTIIPGEAGTSRPISNDTYRYSFISMPDSGTSMSNVDVTVKLKKEPPRDEPPNKKRKKRKCECHCLSVRTLFIFLVVLFVAISCFTSWIIQYRLSREGLQEITQSLKKSLGDNVQKYVDNVLSEAELIVKIENRTLSTFATQMEMLARYRGLVRASRFVVSVAKANLTEGVYRGAKITAPGEKLRYNITSDYVYFSAADDFVIYDPDLPAERALLELQAVGKNLTDVVLGRPSVLVPSGYHIQDQEWYKTGINMTDSQHFEFTDIIVTLTGLYGMSAVIPTFRGGSTVGTAADMTHIFTANMYLYRLNEFLEELGQPGRIVIIDQVGRVIGLDKQGFVQVNGTKVPIVTELNDDSTATFADAPIEGRDNLIRSVGHSMLQRYGSFDNINVDDRYSHKYNGKVWWVNFNSVSMQNLKWTIIIITDSAHFLEKVTKGTQLTIGLGALITIISIIGAALATFAVTIPLKRIANRMNLISTMEFSSIKKKTRKQSRIPLRNWYRNWRRKSVETISPLSEIAQMQNCMSRMEHALLSFSKFAPTSVVREILSKNSEASLYVENRFVTIFFSDIESFTRIAEELDPKHLVKILGEFLAEISSSIAEYEGTIDKFIGDAVMALWNAPRDTTDHALLAVDAAMDFQRKLREHLHAKWRAEGMPLLNCRIGINTGEVLVGNIGSIQRLSYTAIGDNVNLASRLENLCKRYGVNVLISASTYALVRHKYLCRVLDHVVVKGKSQPIFIYEVIEENRKATAEQIKLCRAQEEAMRLLIDYRFEEALDVVRLLMASHPNNTSLELLSERLERLCSLPEAEARHEWLGFEILQEK